MRGPLAPADLFHTGIVVPDIEEWKDRLSRAAGHRWGPSRTADLTVRLPEGERSVRLSWVYSLDAPYLELTEEVPGTPWAAVPGSGLHHIGYFCDDLPGTSRRLETDGFALEACATRDGDITSFAYHRDPAGPRIEIVDRAVLPGFPACLFADAVPRPSAARPEPRTADA